jgi:hypothetical protein
MKKQPVFRIAEELRNLYEQENCFCWVRARQICGEKNLELVLKRTAWHQ